MQVVLAMFRADGERRSFSVVRDMTVIGRREDCDLRIPLGEVSRKHCRIIKDGDAIRLEDLGSSNGTYHNDVRVQEAVLGPGDAVRVGPVTFIVQVDGVPSDDELQPPISETSSIDQLAEFVPMDDPDAPSGQVSEAAPVSLDAQEPGDLDFLVADNTDSRAAPADDLVEFEVDETPAPHDQQA